MSGRKVTQKVTFHSLKVTGDSDIGDLVAGELDVTGALTAGSAAVTGALTAGSAAVTGALTADSAAVTGAVTGDTVTATNAVAGGSLTVTGETGSISTLRYDETPALVLTDQANVDTSSATLVSWTNVGALHFLVFQLDVQATLPATQTIVDVELPAEALTINHIVVSQLQFNSEGTINSIEAFDASAVRFDFDSTANPAAFIVAVQWAA